MNAKKTLMVISALCLTLSAAARAEEDQGVQLAARVGFTLPFGSVLGDNGGGASSFSDTFTGFIPFELEAGYRINPNIMVGAFLQYGIGLPKNCATGASCSGHDISFGIQGHYHFAPKEQIDPWGGVGIGYEILGLSQSGSTSNGDLTLSGFQYITLQGGVDFPVAANFKLAPFINLAIGSYTNESFNGNSSSSFNSAVHELVTVGLRGSFTL